MNFAFTSILLFLVLTPGYLLRITYKSSKLSIKDSNKNLVNELTLSIVPAFLIHTFVIFFTELFTCYNVDFDQLGSLISGDGKDSQFRASFTQLKSFLWPILIYQLVVYSLSLILGYSSRQLVRKFKWDRKFRPLRFSNKWHYIFSGECLDFPDVPDDYSDITEKVVDVLCKVNSETILYTGILFNYYVDSVGDLEAIHIKYPMRRYLSDDGKTDRYYQIPSRYLVIPNSEVININLKYFNIEEISVDEDSSNENIIELEDEIIDETKGK